MELITDIPRLYTGLAEWAGCLIMLLICRRKVSNAALIAISMAAAVLQCGFLTATAGVEAGALWIAIMLLAVFFMFLFIFLCAGISLLGAVYCTAAAFLFAEFAASLEWQLYSWASGRDNPVPAAIPTAVIHDRSRLQIRSRQEKKPYPAQAGPVQKACGSVFSYSATKTEFRHCL